VEAICTKLSGYSMVGQTLVTDEEGKAVLEDVEEGLYFIDPVISFESSSTESCNSTLIEFAFIGIIHAIIIKMIKPIFFTISPPCV